MKHKLHLLLLPFISTALLIGLSACGGTSMTLGNAGKNLGGTRFYSLNSLALSSPPAPSNSNSKKRIGIGPLSIPRLLNRPQIITRKNNTEIDMAEMHQWGGSYKEELMQVMVDNLAALLKTENIEEYPWKFSFKPHYQVRIDIDRFDGQIGKNVVLKARWRLLNNNKELLVKRAFITTPVSGNSYNHYVKAQSQTLAVFSRKIADEINKL